MAKFGIINFHNANNYGAVLQSYALKRVFEISGNECNIIDHHNEHIEKNNNILDFSLRKPRSSLHNLLVCYFKKKKINKFITFRQKYLKPYIFVDNDLENNYDAFITGSDQVWNYLLTGFDKTYFLDFLENSHKKNSYAASFGVDRIPEEIKPEYIKQLRSFGNISVREKRGAQIIKDLLNINVPIVLDPTMLLDINRWKNEFNINNKHRDNYILLYLFYPDKKLLDFSRELSKFTGYRIIIIRSKIKPFIRATSIWAASPADWIDLFLNASFIVTNSFHGTAFSINFNINFVLGLLPKTYKNNSRLLDIVEVFGLENRILTDDNKKSLFYDIDYEEPNRILIDEKEKSLAFLQSLCINN